MLSINTSLLSKKLVDRDALTHEFSNIKPRLILRAIEGLRKLKRKVLILTLQGLFLILILGYFNPVHAQEQTAFTLPHTGYISTYFSSYHPGVDLATDLGAEIHPIAPGTVENIIYDRFDYGTHIIIAHPNGFKSLYGHMGKVSVTLGQPVALTTILGTVGLTGHTSGPHTHLEIIKEGIYINPITLLPKILEQPILQTPSIGGSIQPPPPPKTELKKMLKPDFS